MFSSSLTQCTKPLGPQAPALGLARSTGRSRIPQVPPRLETKLPIVPKVLPVNSGPLNSPPALWAPWENPASPRKHPAMIKGPAPQQKLGCKFPHEVLGATGREGRRPLRGARGPAHDHLTSGEEGPPAVCPPGGVWGASVPEPCCQAWSLWTHERFPSTVRRCRVGQGSTDPPSEVSLPSPEGFPPGRGVGHARGVGSRGGPGRFVCCTEESREA